MKFHYSEKFVSHQCEARYTGVPSVFLRMFGCNLRCPHFGVPASDRKEGPNPEVVKIIENIDQYSKMEDLPLVKTGCDSYCSTYSEFKRFAKKETADELADSLLELLPNSKWGDFHLVITGGEPLLGWQKIYPDLLGHENLKDLTELTFETNGTQFISEEFNHYLHKWTSTRRFDALTFSVSPKLSCSGEPREKAIKPEVIAQYQKIGYTYLKFVVATEDDVAEAMEVTGLYRDAGFTGPVYLMPVGGTTESYYLNRTEVANMALNHGVRFSDRLHIALYGNSWGT